MSFDDFKQENGGEPVDGEHTAYLERAVLRDTRNGKAIKIEWRTTDLNHYWESWHSMTGGGKPHTQRMLTAVGVDFKTLASFEQLEDELALVEDRAYIVKVSHNGTFLNTAVVERAQGVQTDLPVDTTGLPANPAAPPAERVAAATRGGGDLFGDDDVPF